jgi:hypothetical protein
LEHGVRYCIDQGIDLPSNWENVRRDQLAMGELIEVASEISKRLGAPGSGLYAEWLQKTVGVLRATTPGPIRALREWGCPIATTNYDVLITQETGLEPITWQDREWLVQFHRGEKTAVLHLHGIFTHARSVVLGAHSYEDVIRDPAIRDVMRALVIGKSLVFVGCGTGGLRDPNIGGLLRWYQETLKDLVCPSVFD